MTKPILVCMTWRGGARFERCLASISRSAHHFERILISVTSDPNSPDMTAALNFQQTHPDVEVICTGVELPTMQHQTFWVDYLERTGVAPDAWIFWLAYDDEVRGPGIEATTDAEGNWPLRADTAYFGPWAMRYEEADELWHGDPDNALESWTSLPITEAGRVPVTSWIVQQFQQPTYIQMSGSVIQFSNYLELRDGRPRKKGPMRIEMASAACASTTHVAEFPEPITVIYVRSNSDRTTYGSAARKEDVHLLAWLLRYATKHPRSLPDVARAAAAPFRHRWNRLVHGVPVPAEEWRKRGFVRPQ